MFILFYFRKKVSRAFCYLNKVACHVQQEKSKVVKTIDWPHTRLGFYMLGCRIPFSSIFYALDLTRQNQWPVLVTMFFYVSWS
uniref:Uncharacterized protein n=1 Tax=Arundo donax TaxID=35708 RepID=A0A0A9FHQ9_ARUDO